jgi:hypothetical protein
MNIGNEYFDNGVSNLRYGYFHNSVWPSLARYCYNAYHMHVRILVLKYFVRFHMSEYF